MHPADLLGLTYTEVIRRAGIDAMEVGDAVTGCVQQFGPQDFNIGRNAYGSAFMRGGWRGRRSPRPDQQTHQSQLMYCSVA